MDINGISLISLKMTEQKCHVLDPNFYISLLSQIDTLLYDNSINMTR